MKPIISGMAVMLLILISTGVQARDTRLELSVQEVLNRDDAGTLLGDMQFYFAGQPHSAVQKSLGEFQSNRKTNAFGKSDKEACQWAMLSALKSLKERAESLGGNAVVNIRSNYKNNEFVSDSEYQCGAGAIMAGVALKGDVVQLGQ